MSTRTANGQSRRPPEHDDWAVAVKTRAGWKCEGCGLEANWVRDHHGRFDACHILPYQEYPDRRFDVTNGKALCYFPMRNHPKGLGMGYGCHNAMSGHWGHGQSNGAVHHRGGRKLASLGWFLLADLLWVAALVADGHLRHWASLRPWLISAPGRSFTALLTWLGTLLGLWVACYVLAAWACRHHWLRRSVAFAWHIPGRLVRKVDRHAPR